MSKEQEDSEQEDSDLENLIVSFWVLSVIFLISMSLTAHKLGKISAGLDQVGYELEEIQKTLDKY